MAEVKQHRSKDDAWLVLKGKVTCCQLKSPPSYLLVGSVQDLQDACCTPEVSLTDLLRAAQMANTPPIQHFEQFAEGVC